MANLYILLAIFMWSSIGVIVRLSDVSIFNLIFYSLVTAMILQAVVISQKKYRKEISDIRRLKYPLMLGCVGLLNNITFYYAFRNTTIANAVLSHYTAPVIVAVLAALFLDERITKKIIIAIIIASAGLLFMLNGFSFAKEHVAGILSGLVSGFTYAVVIILARTHAREFSPLVLTFFSNAAILILLLPFVGAFPLNAFWSFAFMGIVNSTIAPILYFKGLQNVTAGNAAVLGYLEPVSAIIFSMIFLKEIPAANSVYGGILILFSGYLIIKSDGKTKRTA